VVLPLLCSLCYGMALLKSGGSSAWIQKEDDMYNRVMDEAQPEQEVNPCKSVRFGGVCYVSIT
jgi:starvation-inducible outer membrane lipoprotein